MKEKIHRLIAFILSLFMVVGGLQIIFVGFLESSVSDSIYTFDGIERLMGFVPLFMGGMLAYLLILQSKSNR